MSTVLVSILSENNIPTYLFIKQMEGRFDKHIFLVTESVMRKEAYENLATAIGGYGDGARRITLDPDNYKFNTLKLADKVPLTPEADKYIVNLTGGTKPMSLAVFSHFSQFEGTRFYYMSGNCKSIYDFESDTVAESVTVKIPLADYLNVYGLKIASQSEPEKTRKDANALFDSMRKVGFDAYRIPEIRQAKQDYYKSLDKPYYAGGWFEEYCYFRIKDELSRKGLSTSDIAFGVKIAHFGEKANENEIDVLLVKDNNLYTIECKVGKSPTEVYDAMYKASAISKYIGFRVGAYIFWLQKLDTQYTAGTESRISKLRDCLGVRNVFTGKDLAQNNISDLIK